LYFLIGFEPALMALVDQQDLATEALGRIAEWQISAGRKFVEIGVDAVRISDDYGSQKNLLMSPKIWREVIRPHLARVVGFYKAEGIPVALHSCGNLKSIMDDLVELEFAAFNIQTNANDLASYKLRYGTRFRLWGGVSTQSVLAAGSPSEIRRAVRGIFELFGRDGLMILEPDQVVALPEENLKIFWETAHTLQMRNVWKK
jgi:uroporphyrinogen-III decarboxylase